MSNEILDLSNFRERILRRGSRLYSIDAARFIALLGIIFVHTSGSNASSFTGIERAFYIFGNGVCPALFAILLAFTLSKGWEDRVNSSTRLQYFVAILPRGLFIIFVGLILGSFSTPIAVILVHLGLLLLVGYPLIFLGLRSLAIIAAVWIALIPQVTFILRRDYLPTRFYENITFDFSVSPVSYFNNLLFDGYYPIIYWLLYFMVGVILCKFMTAKPEKVWGVAIFALFSAVAAKALALILSRTNYVGSATDEIGLYGSVPTDKIQWLFVDYPHSGTTLDLIYTSAFAALIIAACFIIFQAIESRLKLFMAARIITAAGAFTLSLYVLHVLMTTDQTLIGLVPENYALQSLIVVLIGSALVITGRRGPLEKTHKVLSDKFLAYFQRRALKRAESKD